MKSEVSEMLWNGIVAAMLWSGLGIVFSQVTQDPSRGTFTATVVTVLIILENYRSHYI